MNTRCSFDANYFINTINHQQQPYFWVTDNIFKAIYSIIPRVICSSQTGHFIKRHFSVQS
ncbi:Uncharacterised protein [Vibrio parahaemolyticus]|nr:Uncharacterised protein [Vibrio parahaemolyticus]